MTIRSLMQRLLTPTDQNDIPAIVEKHTRAGPTNPTACTGYNSDPEAAL
ncbi:MAG: hypothetical protein RLY67_746, partial [Pseudomonadota bacterium]